MPLNLVFRYDDLSDCCKKIDLQIAQLFLEHEIKLTVGYIPFLDSTQSIHPLTFFKDDNFEVAVHGYQHKIFSKIGRWQLSEFYSRSLQEQQIILAEAKLKTEEVFQKKPYSFIPPWNSYDDNTLNTLITLGFKNISARVARKLPVKEGLQYIPATCTIADFYHHIHHYNFDKLLKCDATIVVFFHSYEIIESGEKPAYQCNCISLQNLKQVLTFIKGNQLFRNSTICDLGNTGKFTLKRYQQNTNLLNIVSDFLKPFNFKIYK